MKKSRMYSFVGPRWNPVVGCTHQCVYCWAKQQSKRQRRRCQLCYEFVPHLHEDRLTKVPKTGTVFVVDMGDLFCRGVPDEWIHKVIESMNRASTTTFFLETKNPARYYDFLNEIPKKSVLSATIETTEEKFATPSEYRRYDKVSKAPPVINRLWAMYHLPKTRFRKHISIEPILDFHPETFVTWMRVIKSVMVSVGYDNYNHRLPEPALNKTEELIAELEKFTKVERKNIRKAWWE